MNPNATGAGQPEFIPAQGSAISMRSISNLKHTCFFICHCKCTSRAVIPTNVLLSDIRALRAQRLLEAFKETPVTVPEIVEKNWPKTLETILLFLGQNLGVRKIPLAYIVRNEATPPALPDPSVGDTDLRYGSHDEEMIARAPFYVEGAVGANPIHNDTYVADNNAI